jgi:hypothetical protein
MELIYIRIKHNFSPILVKKLTGVAHHIPDYVLSFHRYKVKQPLHRECLQYIGCLISNT